MRRGDIAAGLVLAGLGIYVIQQSRLLTYRDEFGPGPGLLPFWLGILLTLLASIVVVSGIQGRPRSSAPPEFGARPRIFRALLAWAGLMVTVAAFGALGFMMSFGLVSFFQVYVIERHSLQRAVTVAVVISLVFLLLFRVILPVPLPLNRWGF